MKNIIRIKSITEAHDMLNLPKPLHPLVSVVDFAEAFKNFEFQEGVTFVPEYYQINLKEGFSGSFIYGRNSYDFQEGCMSFMKPGQTIQIVNQQEIDESTGLGLIFHPDLIRKSHLGETIDDYSFFGYDVNEALHLSDREKGSIRDLLQKIEDEYNNNIDKHSQELIIGNIEMLLKYAQRFYDRQFYTRTSLNKDILSQFDKILKDYYSSDKPLSNGVLTVKRCAAQLNVSDNYLGDLLKSETGRSAKDHINEYVIETAKNKLLASNESISQIAFSLGFEYPQGFNKLFKSKVGQSPSQYRTLN